MGRKACCTLRSRRVGLTSQPPVTSAQVLNKNEVVSESEAIQVNPKQVEDDYGTPKSKRMKSESFTLSARDCPGSPTEYGLAMELLAFEKLGYLSKADQVADDDADLVQYGDSFGLATLSEYPAFFKLVPQHPHYGETSLAKVNEVTAENYWDSFMPLVQRGLSAVRKNNKNDIAAVERRIAHFTDQGFDLGHLRAFINTARSLQAAEALHFSELEKIKMGIQGEKKRIDDIISGKSVVDEIEQLVAEKAKYQKLISDIDTSLIHKKALLEEEKSIQSSHSSPAYKKLLEAKEHLDKRISEVSNMAKALTIEGVMKALEKERV